MQGKNFFFTTYDGLDIRYAIVRPNSVSAKATVIYVGGRREFIEKNAETIDRLEQRGFLVCTFDWRGQGLSSRMLENPHKGYVSDFNDYIKDLHFFVTDVIPHDSPAPRILLAHSMGANAGLRYLHDHPGFFDFAVMISPMFGIRTYPFPLPIARKMAIRAIRKGRSGSYLPGHGNYRILRYRRGNPFTGDRKRFLDESKQIFQNPDLALGGVTFGWLAAAFDSIDLISQPGYAEAIDIPVQIISGTRDRIVDRRAHKQICRRLKKCRFVKIKGARHEILKEKDHYQKIFWQAFDSFLNI